MEGTRDALEEELKALRELMKIGFDRMERRVAQNDTRIADLRAEMIARFERLEKRSERTAGPLQTPRPGSYAGSHPYRTDDEFFRRLRAQFNRAAILLSTVLMALLALVVYRTFFL